MQELKTYQWDGNGNLVGDGTTNYTWDARDLLIAATDSSGTTNYGYDTRRLRVRIQGSTGAGDVLLDGGEEYAQYQAGNGGRVSRVDHDPMYSDALLSETTVAKRYHVTDALGSSYRGVDESASTVVKYGYDVYGRRTVVDSGNATAWGFAGRRHEPQDGIVYYRRRYLDTTTGTWIAADPAGTGDGPNRYLYVHGAPTAFRDPSGLASELGTIDYTQKSLRRAAGAAGWSCYFQGFDMILQSELEETFAWDVPTVWKRAFRYQAYVGGREKELMLRYADLFTVATEANGFGVDWECLACPQKAGNPLVDQAHFGDTGEIINNRATIFLFPAYWEQPSARAATRIHELVHAAFKIAFVLGNRADLDPTLSISVKGKSGRMLGGAFGDVAADIGGGIINKGIYGHVYLEEGAEEQFPDEFLIQGRTR